MNKNNTAVKKIRFFKLPGKVTTGQIPYAKIVWISFLINTANVALVLLLKPVLPPEVPLYYGHAEGQEQLAQNWELAIPGALSLVVTIINLVLASLVNKDFLKKILVITSFCISFLALVTIIKIILLVGSF